MSSAETITKYQKLADDMLSVVQTRLADTAPVEILNQRGDKLLQVVEEADSCGLLPEALLNQL